MLQYGCCVAARDYALAEEAGFDYAELSGAELYGMRESEFRDTLKTVESGRIPALCMNDFCGASLPLLGAELKPERVRDYSRRLFERAARLGIKKAGIGSPRARNVPEGYPAEKAAEQFGGSLACIADAGAEFGIVAMLEPLNDGVCNFINYTAQAVELLDALRHPSLALVFDFHHSQLMGESLELMEKYVPTAAHLHLSDCEAGRRVGLSEKNGGKYRRWARALGHGAYQGTISLEAQDLQKNAASESLRILRACFSDGD